MAKIDIHSFKETEAQEVSQLIGNTIMELNAGDYDMEVLMDQAKFYTADRVKELARLGHTYVATEDKRVVAVGTIVELPDQPGTAEIRSLFVSPDEAFRGIGRAMMMHMETDEFYQKADRIMVDSSVDSCEFCLKLGFDYLGGKPVFENNDHYHMVKVKA